MQLVSTLRPSRSRKSASIRLLLAAALAAPFLAVASEPKPFRSDHVTAPELLVHEPPSLDAATDLYTFIGIRGATAMERGNPGPYLLDNAGNVVWYGGIGSVLNVGRHVYQGSPVIAYYTGARGNGSQPELRWLTRRIARFGDASRLRAWSLEAIRREL